MHLMVPLPLCPLGNPQEVQQLSLTGESQCLRHERGCRPLVARRCRWGTGSLPSLPPCLCRRLPRKGTQQQKQSRKQNEAQIGLLILSREFPLTPSATAPKPHRDPLGFSPPGPEQPEEASPLPTKIVGMGSSLPTDTQSGGFGAKLTGAEGPRNRRHREQLHGSRTAVLRHEKLECRRD